MGFIKKTLLAYRNKLTNRLWGFAVMPARARRKGYVLLSYINEPFTVPPWKKFSNYHTMYWECYEIARLFSERGYEVISVNAKNPRKVPRKNYSVCLDVEDNFERYAPFLPKECKKIFHILISHWEAYNEAEKKRLEMLRERRGVILKPRRQVSPSRDAELADFLEGFGNKAIFGTFSRFAKEPFHIPISAVVSYPFPENKDWEKARKNFLWVGGGGMVLKGLDMILEAFSRKPELTLHVCGPVFGEPDFVEEYKKELTETDNIKVYGRIDVGGEKFREILNSCAFVIYPSAGEGTSGSIVQAMHDGLIPVVTHETGLKEDSGYIPLENPTPESIALTISELSEKNPDELKEKSRAIWKYATSFYTRESFSRIYARFIDEKLKI